RNANQKSLRLCGSTPVHDIISNPVVTIYFHSDSINNPNRGFFFSYQSAYCNRSYTGSSGVVTNIAYPGRFNGVKYCTMNISTSVDKTISLYFSRLEMYDTSLCTNNYIKVYDGANTSAPLLRSICGFSTPDPVYSSGNSLHVVSNYIYMGYVLKSTSRRSDDPGIHISRTNEMVIKMKTDPSNSGPGFKLRFSSNAFLPDSSVALIQRYEMQDREDTSDRDFIYLD
ncbi:cubilin, partial [Nephila pilipes]